MKKFKKIYLEITNQCNLNCAFCIHNKRKPKYLSVDEFKTILSKIEKHTDYLYFHIMGEPLLHPKITSLIKIASNHFKINITTNGYLIKRIKSVKTIRQLNISLHSYDDKYNISVKEYMNNIFEVIDSELLKNTYISLRFWVNNKHHKSILDEINAHYKTNFDVSVKNGKVNNHIFINSFHEFIWPDLNNDYYDNRGTCYALTDHIGILSDGTIVPCCLDSEGIINLGNIYLDEIEDILNCERVINMKNNFKCNKKVEKLCKHCQFLEK